MEKSERCISLKSVWGDKFRGCWWIRWWRLGMPSMGRTKGLGGRHPPKTSIWVKHWKLKEESNTSGWKSKMEVRWGKAGGINTGDRVEKAAVWMCATVCPDGHNKHLINSTSSCFRHSREQRFSVCAGHSRLTWFHVSSSFWDLDQSRAHIWNTLWSQQK